MIKHVLLAPLIAFMVVFTAFADELLPTIHDGHIHYDGDVWEILPPDRAIGMLTDQNIQRAIVSATPTEGAELLYKEDPDLVIPFLRPYKNIRHRFLWFKDPTTPDFIRDHLKRAPYRGIGEFHVFGPNIETDIVLEIIEIARQNKLALHPHTNLAEMRYLLSVASDIPVLWAHGGFDVPVAALIELMEEYPKLYIELSLREGITDEDDVLTPEWRALLIQYKDRFLIGMDTYKPSRWADLPEIAEESRHWLNQLPEDTAIAIARGNLDRLLPK